MNFSSYPIKKSKNFGYTFSIIFFLVFLYFFSNGVLNYSFLIISLSLTLVTILKPSFLSPFSFLWDKFGLLIGKFVTPIILCSVYLITIIPTNIVLRIFSIDLLKKKKNVKVSSYWIERKNKNINFKKQF